MATPKRKSTMKLQTVRRRKQDPPLPTKPGEKTKARSTVQPSYDLTVEDSFEALYETVAGTKTKGTNQPIVAPPYNPELLITLAEHNNVLGPCIATMVTNCDSTGFEIVPKEDTLRAWRMEKRKKLEARAVKEQEAKQAEIEDAAKKMKPVFETQPPAPGKPGLRAVKADTQTEDPPMKKPGPAGDETELGEKPPAIDEGELSLEKYNEEHYDEMKALRDFFDEPFPEETFTSQRRDFRFFFETTGNGFFEVVRNAANEVVFLRHIPAHMMRLVRLDEPVPVTKKINRFGNEIEITYPMRERRFVQLVGTKHVYFKELGVTREVNRDTGEWGQEDIPVDKRGREIMWLAGNPDPKTMYGLPRWMGQMLSVVGSRRAEEVNLGFFEQGGVPPMIILVHGGEVHPDLVNELNEVLNSGGISHKIPILSATSTTGDIAGGMGAVKITIERFGSDRKDDAMFQEYDKNAGDHVKSSFRLPALFFGTSDSYNYATAYASYVVAEAQVFKPERDEFDSMLTLRLLPLLPEGKKYQFRTLPVSVHDSTLQVEAIGTAVDAITPQERVRQLNKTAGLDMVAMPDQPAQNPLQAVMDLINGNVGSEQPGKKFGTQPAAVKPSSRSKIDTPSLLALAENTASAIMDIKTDPDGFRDVLGRVQLLKSDQWEVYTTLLASKLFNSPHAGGTAAAQLAGCALALLEANLQESETA